MPTSEMNRFRKIISNIAKENGQKYTSVRITHTTDSSGNVDKYYEAYINDLIPWLSSNSIKGLIEVCNNHIKNKKGDIVKIEANANYISPNSMDDLPL